MSWVALSGLVARKKHAPLNIRKNNCSMLIAAAFVVLRLISEHGREFGFALVASVLAMSARGGLMPANVGSGPDENASSTGRETAALQYKLPLAPFFVCGTLVVLVIPVMHPGQTFWSAFHSVF